jgi:hypothetical protein
MRGGTTTVRPLAAYRPPPAHRPSPTIAVKPTFDPVLCEQLWPRVNEIDDKLLSEACAPFCAFTFALVLGTAET